MSKLSVSTELSLLVSGVLAPAESLGVLGVFGVLIPIDGVLGIDLGVLDGVPSDLSFCVASLFAAGDIVFKRSIVDLGEGL